MITKHILTSDQKLKAWGYGEWVEEPDKAEFEHQGIKCSVIRQFAPHGPEGGYLYGGHLCGYVCLPSGHPWAIEDRMKIDCGAHGGLTYGKWQEDGNYWIGFDCAHSEDVIPSYANQEKELYKTDELFKNLKDSQRKFQEDLKSKYPELKMPLERSYKNINYVIQECKNLAEQVIKAQECKQISS